MADQSEDNAIRHRLAQTEEVLGRVAQDLLENRYVNGALTRAFDARHRALQAQEAAMGALNIPSAGDIERLTRRLRSVSTRLEGVEESVERLERAVRQLAAGSRLEAIEEQLTAITRMLQDLGDGLPGATAPISREQERLAVDAAAADADAPPATGGAAKAARPSRTAAPRQRSPRSTS